jgi:hypothetical protein
LLQKSVLKKEMTLSKVKVATKMNLTKKRTKIKKGSKEESNVSILPSV